MFTAERGTKEGLFVDTTPPPPAKTDTQREWGRVVRDTRTSSKRKIKQILRIFSSKKRKCDFRHLESRVAF